MLNIEKEVNSYYVGMLSLMQNYYFYQFQTVVLSSVYWHLENFISIYIKKSQLSEQRCLIELPFLFMTNMDIGTKNVFQGVLCSISWTPS